MSLQERYKRFLLGYVQTHSFVAFSLKDRERSKTSHKDNSFKKFTLNFLNGK